MAHGNIYAPEKVDAALGNYFRVGNLAALRELALLWVADRVEDSLQSYRAATGSPSPGRPGSGWWWPSPGRPAASSSSAGPPAWPPVARASCWASTSAPTTAWPGRRPSCSSSTRLLGELGGRYAEVTGNDIPAALVDFARAENATQLVLGASRRSPVGRARPGIGHQQRHPRWPPRSTSTSSTPTPRRPTATRLPAPGPASCPPRPVNGWCSPSPSPSIGLAGFTVLLNHNRASVGSGEGLLVYLGVVVVVAAVGGLVPALVTAVAAVFLDDWFLVRPYGSLTVERGGELGYLAAFACAPPASPAWSSWRPAAGTRRRARSTRPSRCWPWPTG